VCRCERDATFALQGLHRRMQFNSIDKLEDSGCARAYMPVTEDHDGEGTSRSWPYAGSRDR